MDDLAFGRAVRVLRRRKGWSQARLARAARLSRAKTSRVERGDLGGLRLQDVRAVGAQVDLRVLLLPRGRGAELDRLVNARHSEIQEFLVAMFADLPGWVASPETSFSIWGERGVIDILAWHAGSRALLVVEIKTEIVDPAALVASVDRYRRLAPAIAEERGWASPATVSCWVVVAQSRSNERRLAMLRSMLRAAFPDDGRRIAPWLRKPAGPVAALSFVRMSAKSPRP